MFEDSLDENKFVDEFKGLVQAALLTFGLQLFYDLTPKTKILK